MKSSNNSDQVFLTQKSDSETNQPLSNDVNQNISQSPVDNKNIVKLDQKSNSNENESLPPISSKNQQNSRMAQDVVSIENFEQFYKSGVPVFTEQATINAMKKLGIIPADVKIIEAKDFQNYPNIPEVRKHLVQMLTNRRNLKIDQIKKERLNIMKSNSMSLTNRSPSKISNYSAPINITQVEHREDERLQRLQQKEIESLIISELTRQKILQQDIQRQENLQKTIAEREASTRAKMAADAQRRKEKELKVLDRINKREMEIIAMQDENERMHQQLIEKEKEEFIRRQREKSKAEQERLKKLDEKKLEQAKLIKMEQKMAFEKELQIEKRDKERIQKNLKDTEAMRQAREKKQLENKQRIEENHKREEQLLEEKKQELLKKELEASLRNDEFQKRRKEFLEVRKRQSEKEAQKHREVVEALAQQEQSRKEKILQEQEKHEERIKTLLKEREERTKKAKEDEMKRVEEIKQKREQDRIDDIEMHKKVLEEDKKAQERIDAIRRQNEIEKMKKSAEQELKIQMMEENAKQLERQKEYERQEKQKIKDEREKRALDSVLLKKKLGQQRREAAIQTTFKRTEVIEEFRTLLRQGGSPDLQKLADRFGLDLEELKSKVDKEELNEKQSSSLPTLSLKK